MQLDNEALKKILSMNDAQLNEFISSVAAKSNIPLQNINFSDLQKIRSALNSVSLNPDIANEISKFGKKEGLK